MEPKPRCEIVFERSCNRSEFTQTTYQNNMKHFMQFCKVDEMSELLEADQKLIQHNIILYRIMKGFSK